MKKIHKHIAIILTSLFIALSITAINALPAHAEDTDAEANYKQSLVPKPVYLPGPDPDDQLTAKGGSRNILTQSVLPKFALATIGLVGGLSIMFLLIAGVRFMTAYGNEESAENAKKQAIYSVLGFFISILSYTIVTIIINLDYGEVENNTPAPAAEDGAEPVPEPVENT